MQASQLPAEITIQLPEALNAKILFQPELLDAISNFTATDSFLDSPWVVATISTLLGATFSLVAAYFTNRQNQIHTIALKHQEAEIRKQEFLHSQQLSALQALSEINHTIAPIDWSHPDFSSHDAYTDIAAVLPSLISVLGDYLKKHGYLLPNGVEQKIWNAIRLCNESKSDTLNHSNPDYEPTKAELEAAEEVFSLLSSSIESLKLGLGIAK